MQPNWNLSASLLPQPDESVDFLLEDRQQPLRGKFANGIFHSRWADYDAQQVSAWRSSDAATQGEKSEDPAAIDTRVFASALKTFSWS